MKIGILLLVLSTFLAVGCSKNSPDASTAADATSSPEAAAAPAPEQAASMAEPEPASETIADAEIPLRGEAPDDEFAEEGDAEEEMF